MNIPKIRLTGPLQQRDATVFLAISAFLITSRAPMGFVMLALGPVVVMVVQGLRRHSGAIDVRLRLLLGSMLVCSTLSLLLFNQSQLASPGSSLAVAIVVGCVVLGTLATGRPRCGLERLVDGIQAGLVFHWLVSMFEATTGIKMLPLMYPDANTTRWVEQYRFYVTSLFPNYNDYSVAMTLLCTLLVTRMLFDNRVGAVRKVMRLVIFFTALFEVAYMGSRGCLIAIIVMVGLVLLQNIRAHHPGTLGIRTFAFGVLSVATVLVGVLASPWLKDNSAAQRGQIAGNIGQMISGSPLEGLLGWGSYVGYQQAADRAFPNKLMDPHNMLLEIVVVFGIPTLLAYLACWWFVVRHGLIATPVDRNWRSVALAVIVATYPLLGVVSSSTLRYYLAWLFIVAAVGWVRLVRRERVADVRR
ncbi:O-antigen ligase family protein [Luteococcus sp. OSA5]|uniref:O-antigen ligase family protein n=1 Tax=Luteococcus sp. OSA5 TaxID=3401630 RepID=UPI003B432DDD